MTAPAYNSYVWIQQDWRYLKFKPRALFPGITDVSYDRRCGDREKDGKIRLCLPRIVIVRLLRTKTGEKALRQQMKKKLESKTKRVPWNPTIAKAMKKFYREEKDKDDPKLRTRKSRNVSKPNVWHVKYAQTSSPGIIQNKYYKLKKFKTPESARNFFNSSMKRTRPFMRYKIISLAKGYNTYYK